MVVDAEIARQILSGKRSMIRVVRNGARCPYRQGHVYVIQTRAKATVGHITITEAKPALFEDKPVWTIRFKKGDHTDKDRLPAARVGGPGGDYTDNAARALNGTGSEVSEALQARYAANGAERHAITLAERKERLAGLVSEIRTYGKDPATNAKLREAERRIRQTPARVV